jgi:tRNA pseudouridine38-40 synthase
MDLAYDGTGFRGWAAQRDPTVPTIEAVLAQELGNILRESVRLSVAGRTDAGVHALGQVASFRTSSARTCAQIKAFLNGRVAPEIAIASVQDAPEGFDARFSATARAYRYVIDTATVPDPFTGRFTWHRPGDLDVAAMRRAAAPLVGEQDFTSFCHHPGAGRSTVRDLQRLTVHRDGERIEIGLRANAFLHHMVRIIVGALVLVGDHRSGEEEPARMLEARDRSAAPKAAPARGLTLQRVTYGRRGR